MPHGEKHEVGLEPPPYDIHMIGDIYIFRMAGMQWDLHYMGQQGPAGGSTLINSLLEF